MTQKSGNIVMAKVKIYKKTATALLNVPSNKLSFDYYEFLLKVYKTVICDFIKIYLVKKIVIHIDSGNSDRKKFEAALLKFSIQFSRHPYVAAGNKIKVFLY